MLIKSQPRKKGLVEIQITGRVEAEGGGLFLHPTAIHLSCGSRLAWTLHIAQLCLHPLGEEGSQDNYPANLSKIDKIAETVFSFPLNYPRRGSSMIKLLRESSFFSILHLCVQTLSPISAAKICLLLHTLNSVPLQFGHKITRYGCEKFCISNTCTHAHT